MQLPPPTVNSQALASSPIALSSACRLGEVTDMASAEPLQQQSDHMPGMLASRHDLHQSDGLAGPRARSAVQPFPTGITLDPSHEQAAFGNQNGAARPAVSWGAAPWPLPQDAGRQRQLDKADRPQSNGGNSQIEKSHLSHDGLVANPVVGPSQPESGQQRRARP